MRYKQQYDGEWVFPKMNQPYKMMCCDCGLVHIVKFAVMKITKKFRNGTFNAKRVYGHKVMLAAWRDVAATEATRRQRKRKIKVLK